MTTNLDQRSPWTRIGADLTAHGRGFVFSWYKLNRAAGFDRATARKMACDMAHGMMLGSLGRCTR